MKKPLLMVSAAMLTGLASAQSSVTIFGLLDVTLQKATGSVADRTQLTQGAYGASRLGFRGVEDLGGGLSASFHLEAAVFPDSGIGGASNSNNQASGTATATAGTQGLTFNRRSTVSLISKDWGELRVGRDYTPTFWNLLYGDVFLLSGIGLSANYTYNVASTSIVGTRASNSISYWTPNTLKNFGVQYMHYLGENPSNAQPKDGTGDQVRLFYAGDGSGFSAGASWNKTSYSTGDLSQKTVYAGYDFKVVKIVGSYSHDALGVVDGKGGTIGAQVPLGAHLLKASYSQYITSAAGSPKVERFAVGDVYYLSKRTWVYGTLAHQSNSGGSSAALGGAVTGPNQPSNGAEIGLVVSF
jgi:predicted porin